MQKFNVHVACIFFAFANQTIAMSEAQQATEPQNPALEAPLPLYLVDTSGQSIELDDAHAQRISCATIDEALFSPDENFLITLTRIADSSTIINMWHSATHAGSMLCVTAHMLQLLRFSPDGTHLFIERKTAHENEVEQWCLKTGFRQQIISRSAYNDLESTWPQEDLSFELRPLDYYYFGSIRKSPVVMSPHCRYAIVTGRNPKIFDIRALKRQP